MNYTTWLEIIKQLATRRPVVVIGATHWKLPDTDITAGRFIEQVASMGQAVISALDATPLWNGVRMGHLRYLVTKDEVPEPCPTPGETEHG